MTWFIFAYFWMLAFILTDFVFVSFCCVSASVFAFAFGSVFVIVSSCLRCLMFFVVFVSLCHCCASFCFFLLICLLVFIISIYFDFSYLYVLWYDWLRDFCVGHDLCGCSSRSQCVCLFRICIYLKL